MKKIIMLVASIVMIFAFASISFANENVLLIAPNPMVSNNAIRVQLDGQYLDFVDSEGDVVDPQIINGRTMVPFRKIFTSLEVADENIGWIDETKTATAKKGDMVIENILNDVTDVYSVAKKIVSGEEINITLDSAPVIVDGRTLVPARFIAESMGKKVGWDAENRTVIIIDEEKLNSDLESSISKYMEIAKLQTTAINTFDITVDLDANIDYTEKGNKANNTSIDVDGKIDMIKSDDAIYMDLKLELSGKGDMYEAIKEIDLKNIDVSIIASGNKMYMKSALLGEEYKDKWIAAESDSISEMFDIFETAYANPGSMKFLMVDENNLNVSSYDMLKMTSELYKQVLNDENIKVSGTTTKKYEVKVDFIDLINFMNEYGSGIDVALINKAEMKATGSIKNGISSSSKVELDIVIEEETEKISIGLDATGKVNSYNKTYKIEIPSEKDIISE